MMRKSAGCCKTKYRNQQWQEYFEYQEMRFFATWQERSDKHKKIFTLLLLLRCKTVRTHLVRIQTP